MLARSRALSASHESIESIAASITHSVVAAGCEEVLGAWGGKREHGDAGTAGGRESDLQADCRRNRAYPLAGSTPNDVRCCKDVPSPVAGWLVRASNVVWLQTPSPYLRTPSTPRARHLHLCLFNDADLTHR